MPIAFSPGAKSKKKPRCPTKGTCSTCTCRSFVTRSAKAISAPCEVSATWWKSEDARAALAVRPALAWYCQRDAADLDRRPSAEHLRYSYRAEAPQGTGREDLDRTG